MVSITEKYPPLSLDEMVEIANNFDDLDIENKIKAISKVVQHHPLINFATTSDQREFYRARVSKNRSFPLKYTGLLWNHSAPALRARLNVEGDAILYAANQANAAFREVNVADDFVILTLLKIQSGKSVTFLPIGTLATIMRSNAAHLDFPEAQVANTRQLILQCPFREMQSLLIADEFLYNCIMEDNDDYAVSAMTANVIFKKYSNIDAITYPSKKLRSATNYAIKTTDFWEKWQIGSACTLNVKHLALGHFLSDNCRGVESIDDTGFLNWQRSYPVDRNPIIPLNWKKTKPA